MITLYGLEQTKTNERLIDGCLKYYFDIQFGTSSVDFVSTSELQTNAGQRSHQRSEVFPKEIQIHDSRSQEIRSELP